MRKKTKKLWLPNTEHRGLVVTARASHSGDNQVRISARKLAFRPMIFVIYLNLSMWMLE
jgi:hypothetical protein